ncbi:MAG TPA: sensor histidine kinase, partial [Ktedonobacterales bacterium]|nr:sensor histidine kinase [Ktedonobacterales bacterium]
MKGWRWRFGGLYWRLMLSYLLVTLVVALTIGAALAVGQVIHDAQQPGTLPENTLEKQGAAQIASALEQATPDQEALRFLVATPLFDDLQRADQRLTLVAIVDRQGKLLAATACGRQQLLSSDTAGACTADTSRKADALLASSQAQTAIHAILAGAQQSTETTGTMQTGDHFLAVPIPGQEKQPIGVAVAVFAGPIGLPGAPGFAPGEILAAIGNEAQPAGFLVILLVSVVGTLAGALFSRNLTRRLRRIMQAARAWSQGEFQMEIRDSTRDEVSQLALNLNNMAAQLQALLATRRELAVLEERRRLQRDLHDAVKQQLFAAKMHLAAARTCFKEQPEESYQQLVEAEQLAGHAQHELTSLIEALRPAAFADSTFFVALEEQGRAWSRRTGISIEVRVEGQSALPTSIEDALFRVTQETLSNIARHSGATEALIRLAWEEGTLVLTILDNGHGFATTDTQGIGLQSMRERIAAVGGALEIQSTAAGT